VKLLRKFYISSTLPECQLFVYVERGGWKDSNKNEGKKKENREGKNEKR